MIEVRTQAELDKALKKAGDGWNETVKCVGDGEFVVNGSSRVYAYGSSTVYASGSSRVYAYGSSRVYASGSSTVSAYGSSTVYASDSSRVYASGSSTVSAYGSSTVYASDSSTVSASDSSTVSASDSSTVSAYGSSTVYASDSSTVSASGSSTVSAYGSSRVSASGSSTVSASDSSTVHHRSSLANVTATEFVAVHIHSDNAKPSGGVLIKAPVAKALTVEEALQRWMIDTNDDGKVRLFKAVDKELKSERGFQYPIGETVEAPDWSPEPACGGGLHISPNPHFATRYFGGATRWLEVEIAVEDLALCSTHETMPDKAKAKRMKVVREVGYNGQPLVAN